MRKPGARKIPEKRGCWLTRRILTRSLIRVLAILIVIWPNIPDAFAQDVSKEEREVAYSLLNFVKDNLTKKYYDPTFHGESIDTTFSAAKEMIKNAHSDGQMLGIIAQSLMSLDDSHTFLIPPRLNAHVDYGFRIRIIGENAYVIYVKPQSDA